MRNLLKYELLPSLELVRGVDLHLQQIGKGVKVIMLLPNIVKIALLRIAVKMKILYIKFIQFC